MEISDSLAKSIKNLGQAAILTSFADANAYVKSKVNTPSKIELKHQITKFNTDRQTATTITGLRMKYQTHMKWHQDLPRMRELH